MRREPNDSAGRAPRRKPPDPWAVPVRVTPAEIRLTVTAQQLADLRPASPGHVDLGIPYPPACWPYPND